MPAAFPANAFGALAIALGVEGSCRLGFLLRPGDGAFDGLVQIDTAFQLVAGPAGFAAQGLAVNTRFHQELFAMR